MPPPSNRPNPYNPQRATPEPTLQSVTFPKSPVTFAEIRTLLKRGLIGTFHAVSEQHLQRYCTEFDFRWNHRIALGVNDVQRTSALLKGIEGSG